MVEPIQKRSPAASILLWAMVAILIIAGVLLPPISLGKRLFQSGYVRLDSDAAQTSHPDGLWLDVSSAQLDKALRVKLESVPRLEFVSGVASEDWQAAARAWPPHLTLKSPLYSIAFQDEAAPPVHLELSIPNESEPYSLLDLYAWDGAAWRWVPSRLDLATDRIMSDLDRAPQAIVVVQAGAQDPMIGMFAGEGEVLPPEMRGMVTALYPTGLALGPGGVVVGQPASLGGDAALLQIATVVDSEGAFVQDLLSDPSAQLSHLEALVNQVVVGGYAGLNLDYQAVSAAQRDAFTAFVGELSTRLHTAGLELMVTVPSPSRTATGDWDTGGYDWVALLNAAQVDRLLVTLPLDPSAFVEDGPVDQMLNWAVSRVNRYQLLAVFNTAGVQEAGGVFSALPAAEILALFGSSISRMDGGGSELEAGHEVVVGMPAELLAEDPIAASYRATLELDGQEITVWLPSANGLSDRLSYVTEYRLGGIVLNGLSGSSVVSEMAMALGAFLTDAAPPSSQAASLAWAVQDASGGALVQTASDLNTREFVWQAVATPGAYSINGQLNVGGQVADLGRVEVVVVLPPTATPEPEPTQTPEPSPTPAEVASGGASAATPVPGNADAYISGELVNVREGPSTAFRQLGQLAGGTPLDVLAVDSSSTWIRISAPDGTQGWVYVPLCSINVSLGDVPVEDVPTPTPPPTPEGGAPQPVIPVVPPVSGGGFELGGHIRSWNYLAQMSSAGMSWVKVQVHYGQDASGLVSTAHGNGFKIQLSALGSRDMVNQPNFHADYGAWVAGMAAAGADAIEVWNEPNIDAEWPLGQIDPGAYTQLLCSAYNAIKGANPGTSVISAAPAPTGYFGGCSGNGCDDLPWLQGLVSAGAVNCMDYIGAHHNSGATSPSARSGHPADGGGGHHSWYFLPQTQLYYNIFGGSRKLFYTEMGYASQEGVPTFSDWFAWARGITNAQQAAWLAEAASLSSSTGMVRCLIIWNIDFSRYGDDPQDGYAIIRPDGSCPACASLGAVMGR